MSNYECRVAGIHCRWCFWKNSFQGGRKGASFSSEDCKSTGYWWTNHFFMGFSLPMCEMDLRATGNTPVMTFCESVYDLGKKEFWCPGLPPPVPNCSSVSSFFLFSSSLCLQYLHVKFPTFLHAQAFIHTVPHIWSFPLTLWLESQFILYDLDQMFFLLFYVLPTTIQVDIPLTYYWLNHKDLRLGFGFCPMGQLGVRHWTNDHQYRWIFFPAHNSRWDI